MIVSDATAWSSITLLELPITLLENIYSTGVTQDNCHLQPSYFYITGHLSGWLPSTILVFKSDSYSTLSSSHYEAECPMRSAAAFNFCECSANFEIQWKK